MRLLEVLAGHAAVAVENASLYESARREAESATQLLEFGRELSSASSLDDILERVVELTATLIDSPRTSVWIEDEDGWLVARKLHGLTSAEQAEVAERALPRQGRAWHVRRRLRAVRARPGPVHASRQRPARPGRLVRDRAVRRGPADRLHRRRASRRRTSASASFGCSAASRIRRSSRSRTRATTRGSSRRSSRRSRRSRTRSRPTTSTRRCTRAGSPTSRCGSATSSISTRSRLKRLELGALLHDIGKIGIPSEILSKPGRLTAEERALIETHPELGERIIAPIDRLQEVRTIVRHCHERWDGRGYPDGISGDDVPLESRIIFVCDAYHAMTTDRPYRKRLSHPEAVRRLREGAGSQFDGRRRRGRPERPHRPPPLSRRHLGPARSRS